MDAELLNSSNLGSAAQVEKLVILNLTDLNLLPKFELVTLARLNGIPTPAHGNENNNLSS